MSRYLVRVHDRPLRTDYLPDVPRHGARPDSLDVVREMSASEAARNFSAVLDAAERGHSVAVTRAGRRVAMVVPVTRANGAALREVFERWRGHPALDDRFAADVQTSRDIVSGELDDDPWLRWPSAGSD